MVPLLLATATCLHDLAPSLLERTILRHAIWVCRIPHLAAAVRPLLLGLILLLYLLLLQLILLAHGRIKRDQLRRGLK